MIKDDKIYWAFCRLVVAWAATSFTQAALAQQQVSIPEARSEQVIDGNSVNLMNGAYRLSVNELAVGPKDNPLVLTRSWTRDGWRNNFVLTITFSDSGTKANVSIGDETKSFVRVNNVYTPVEMDDTSLTETASNFTYTGRDGTTIVFDKTSYASSSYYGWAAIVGTVLTRPNGEKTTLSYVTAPVPPNVGSGTVVRLSSVNRSDGYQLKFGYGTLPLWDPVSVTGINNAIDYCSPVAASCAGLTQSWPTTTFSYSTDANGIETDQSTDALGRVTRYTITPDSDQNPQLTAIKRPSSATDTTILTYFDKKKRVKTVRRGSDQWSYTFTQPLVGPTRWIARVTDPLTNLRTLQIDGLSTGTLRRFTDPLNRATVEEYDSYMRLIKVTSPEGNYTSLTNDVRGNVTELRRVAKPGSGLPDIVVSAAYPASCTNQKTCDKPSSVTDAKGNVTSFLYDGTHGGTLSITSPPPSTGGIAPQTRYSYTPLQAYFKNSGGSIVPSGQTQFVITSKSECISSASCAGTADEVKTVDSFGPQLSGTANNLLKVSTTTGSGDNILSATTTFAYDMIGNLLTVDGPLPGTADTTRTRYDVVRQIVGIVDPDPDGAAARKHRATRNSYNLDGQVTLVESGSVNSQSDADWVAMTVLQSTTTTYDGNARPTKSELKSGGTTYAVSQTSYDALWRVDCAVTRMDPAQWATQSDACLAQTTGPNGADRVTKTVYDAASEVTQIQLALGTPDTAVDVTNTYTLNSKLATVKDGENNLTTYEYDGFDQLAKTRFPVSTFGGNASSTTDYEQFSYDSNGNVTQKRLRDGQLIGSVFDALNRVTLKDLPSPEVDVSYTYDLQGRLLSTTQGALTVVQGWDALSRLVSEAGPQGTMVYQYDLAGRRTRATWPDGFFVTQDLSVTGEVTAVRENGAASGIGVLATYAYDDLGRRTSLTRGNSTVTSWSYDPVGRLASLAHNVAGTTSDVSTGFAYTPASQIASSTRDNDAYAWGGHYNVNRAYGVNGLNQLTTAGATALGYDARGNLTSSGTSTYSYMAENRMVSGPGGATLSYDPTGRLYQTTGAVTTRFQYDGTDLVAEYNGSNALLRRYVHGPGDDEPLVWYEGSGTTDRRWLHHDERGSVIGTSNSVGTLATISAYDEYGIPASTNSGRFQYTGQTWLPEVGLYYYKARMYSPTLGRFMQTDPVGYKDGINWYAYVGNDPVNGTDPLGLCDPAKDENCINDPKTAGNAPNLPTTETPPATDGIVVTGLRQRSEETKEPGVPQNDELPIVVVGERVKELVRGVDYRIQEMQCTLGSDTYDVTQTTMSGSSYDGATAGGHLHRGNRDPGPGPDDGHSVAARGVVQYMAWGRGSSFGAGKVEFRAGSGFTYQGLGGSQPSAGDIRATLGGMNRGAGRGTKSGGMRCSSR